MTILILHVHTFLFVQVVLNFCKKQRLLLENIDFQKAKDSGGSLDS